MDTAADDGKGFRWLNEYEKSWEDIQEADDGMIQDAIDQLVHKAKRKRLLVRKANIRLGMIRHLFIVVDMSRTMKQPYLAPPSRIACVSEILQNFITDYFDQNPISQLGLIVTRDKRAELLTKLSGNPKQHKKLLAEEAAKPPLGDASLQNSLQTALAGLRHLPEHSSREVLVVYGSLTSCDPGDISETISQLKSSNVRVSVVGLSAEIKLCKTLCSETKGSYGVMLNKKHCHDLIMNHLEPPQAQVNVEASLIRMGFPSTKTVEGPSFCLCHIESGETEGLDTHGYFCPQCKNKYCGLPVDCQVCGLQLVSAAHIARSYQHLFPLPAFQEIMRANVDEGVLSTPCGGCQRLLSEGVAVFKCSECSGYFCNDCDLFIHETLRTCPGCNSKKDITNGEF